MDLNICGHRSFQTLQNRGRKHDNINQIHQIQSLPLEHRIVTERVVRHFLQYSVQSGMICQSRVYIVGYSYSLEPVCLGICCRRLYALHTQRHPLQ